MWILVWKTLIKAFYQGGPTLPRVQPRHSGGWHNIPPHSLNTLSSLVLFNQPLPRSPPESPSSPASPSSLLGTPDITIFFLTSWHLQFTAPWLSTHHPSASLHLSLDPPEIMLSFNDTLARASTLTLDLISAAEKRPWKMPTLRAQCACVCTPQSCYTKAQTGVDW